MKILAMITTLLTLALFTLACTSSNSESSNPVSTLQPPQPIREFLAPINPIWRVPPSIDQQILDSDVIVLASFVSVTTGVQTIPGDSGVTPTYRPKHILTFRASQYLKGTGPDEFAVEVLDHSDGVHIGGSLYEGYLTEADAMTAANELLPQRNAAYDDRPAVLFLFGPLASPTSSGDRASATAGEESMTTFRFLSAHAAVQSNFEYSIDTLSRAWLPAKEVLSSGEDGSSGSTEYITDGSQIPPLLTSLDSMKTRIEEIDAMLQAGNGTEAYADCIYSKLTRERYYRDWTGPHTEAFTINSGLPAGAELYRSNTLGYDQYNVRSVSGADAELFDVSNIDDDEIAANGHHVASTITRPLIEGKYTANFHMQPHRYLVCNFNPTDTNYSTSNVTVTAPANTLHEAFFDPAAIGAAVGADATNGVLKPTAFIVGETATQITGLKWENNQAVLTLSPHASLAHHALDFIELDGSISLTLKADDATVDATAGTHTWSVADQPWHEGDLLVLRIREDVTPPTTPTP